MGSFPRGMAVAVRGIITAYTRKNLSCEDISTLDPAILTGDDLRGDAMLVRTIRVSAVDKEGTNDACVTVCSREVKWGCTRSADYRSGRVTAAIGIPARKSGCVDVCSILYEEINNEIITTCTSSV